MLNRIWAAGGGSKSVTNTRTVHTAFWALSFPSLSKDVSPPPGRGRVSLTWEVYFLLSRGTEQEGSECPPYVGCLFGNLFKITNMPKWLILGEPTFGPYAGSK